MMLDKLFFYLIISRIFYTTIFFLFSQHFQLQIAPPSRTWLAVCRYIYLLISLSNRDSSHSIFFTHSKGFAFHSDFRRFPHTILILAGLKTRREIFHIFHTELHFFMDSRNIFAMRNFSSFKPLFGSGALCTRFVAEIFFLSSLFSLHAAKLLRFGRI